MNRRIAATLAAVLLGCSCAMAVAETPPKMKMTTPIPAKITTPDTVETSIGTLHFSDGLPDAETVTKVYEQILPTYAPTKAGFI